MERNIAGFHARMQGTLLLLRAFALLAIYALLVYGWFVMHREHWTRDGHGLVAFYATAGLAIFLLREIRDLGNDADRWLRGGEFEEEVAMKIDPLRNEGWTVVHNVRRDDGGGNVDHYLAAPRGPAFAIETKSGRLRAADRGQAIGDAIWAKNKFGMGFVHAVIWVGTEPPQQPLQVLHGRSHVWVVGTQQLQEWLSSYCVPAS